MLKQVLFNRVISDEGFSAKLRVFRGFVEYREGDRVAIIPVEPVIGTPLVRISESTRIKWREPHGSEPIPEERRQRILLNVIEALRFRKCNVEFVAP
jgi:hypothetical protein